MDNERRRRSTLARTMFKIPNSQKKTVTVGGTRRWKGVIETTKINAGRKRILCEVFYLKSDVIAATCESSDAHNIPSRPYIRTVYSFHHKRSKARPLLGRQNESIDAVIHHKLFEQLDDLEPVFNSWPEGCIPRTNQRASRRSRKVAGNWKKDMAGKTSELQLIETTTSLSLRSTHWRRPTGTPIKEGDKGPK